MIVQQYFKNDDLKQNKGQEEEDDPIILPDADEEDGAKPAEEDKQDEN